MLVPSASVSALLLLLCQTCQTGSRRSCARHEDSNTSTDQSGVSCCAPIGRWDLMNCDKENTTKKIHKWRRNDRTNFIYKHDHMRRGGGAVTPRRTRVEPSTEWIPVFVSRHISPRKRTGPNGGSFRGADERSKVRAAPVWSFETRHFDDMRSSQSLLWFYYRALSTSSLNSKLLRYCFNIYDKSN